MRVLLLASFPNSIIGFRGDLINALLKSGADVHIGCPGICDDLSVFDDLTGRGVSLHPLPLRRTGTNPMHDFVYFIALIKVILRVRPEMMMAYTLKPVVYGVLASAICRVRKRFALITGLGYAFQEQEGQGTILGRFVKRLYRFSLQYAHTVFFQNPDDMALFRRAGIILPGTKSVVLNGSGIDVSLFSFHPIPQGCASFLLIARFLVAKGVREYVEAAERVRFVYPDVRFILAGWIDEGPDSIGQDELDAWVDRGVVEYIGRLDDVRPAISGSSVYVLPSYREGTPRTVLEAMAMGRAIITTDVPGCRETVLDGVNGYLVPLHSVDALVAAMFRFIDEPELAIRMGAQSRQVAEEKFDVHKVNEKMLSEMGFHS